MVITSSPLNSYTTDMKTWVVTHLTQNPQLCYPANVLFRNKKNTQLSKIVDLVKKKWILPPQQQHQHSTQPHFAINKVGEKSSSHQKATLSFHHVQTRHKQEALNGKERATRPQQLGVFVSCLTGWDFFFSEETRDIFQGLKHVRGTTRSIEVFGWSNQSPRHSTHTKGTTTLHQQEISCHRSSLLIELGLLCCCFSFVKICCYHLHFVTKGAI